MCVCMPLRGRVWAWRFSEVLERIRGSLPRGVQQREYMRACGDRYVEQGRDVEVLF